MTKRFYVSEGEEEQVIDLIDKGSEAVRLSNGSVIRRIDNDLYEVSGDGGCTSVVVVKRNEDFVRLSINGRLIDLKVSGEGEKLITRLGIDLTSLRTLKDLKAPMPGMVMKILVEKGQSVSKGDGLLILEAMKMENQIKATGDAIISDITIAEGKAVEKGQVLIKFDSI